MECGLSKSKNYPLGTTSQEEGARNPLNIVLLDHTRHHAKLVKLFEIVSEKNMVLIEEKKVLVHWLSEY